MLQAIIIFPKFKGLNIIQKIRKKYDPDFKKIKPHITLVYPSTIKDANDKIKKILQNFKPFEIRLKEIQKSTKEFYLYLSPIKGKKNLITLKKSLYKNLKLKWNKPFRYMPHISIGVFQSKKEINKAIKNIKQESLDFPCKIDSVYLLNLRKGSKTIKSYKKYKL